MASGGYSYSALPIDQGFVRLLDNYSNEKETHIQQRNLYLYNPSPFTFFLSIHHPIIYTDEKECESNIDTLCANKMKMKMTTARVVYPVTCTALAFTVLL